MTNKDYIIHQLTELTRDADTGRFACEEIARIITLINKHL